MPNHSPARTVGRKRRPLKILFVSTEAKPFAAVGGLGSVMFSLPRALANIGHDARVLIPRYLCVDAKAWRLQTAHQGLLVPTGNRKGPEFLECNVMVYRSADGPKDPVTSYFLENQEYYEQRQNIYGYADDPVRWALLCRGALEFLKVSDWLPDALVVSDWHAGLLANYLKTLYKKAPRISRLPVLFSIHNIAHQGKFNYKFVGEADRDNPRSPLPAFDDPKLLKVNGMHRAVTYADAINTVSPTYAREILTAEYGEGVEPLLKKRKKDLYGILNGIDNGFWDPRRDPMVPHKFSVQRLGPRRLCRRALQRRFGLPASPGAFLLAVVSRMSEQKGFGLLEPVMANLLEELDIQLIAVGEGDLRYMEYFLNLSRQFPRRVAVNLKFDEALPHLIYAGADAILIPSRFEPSGLTQMEAMRYGAVPIVRKTGGLADTVEDNRPAARRGTGFVFERYEPLSLLTAIVRACETFQHKPAWQRLQKRAMRRDFTWEHSAKLYEALLRKIIRHRTSAPQS